MARGTTRIDSDDDDNDNSDWEIDAILGVKKNLRKKDVEFLVQWKNKPASKNSWEMKDEEKMTDEMLDPFADAIEHLLNKRTLDDDEEVEDKALGQDEYVVEDILGVQFNADFDRVEYFIKWEGWDNQFNNWEPEENLNCPDFLKFFETAAKHLKTTFGRPKKSKKAGPKSRTSSSKPRYDSDEEAPAKKRPGPKSKTILSSVKKPGPKSKTLNDFVEKLSRKSRVALSDDEDEVDSAPKRPGPRSRTVIGPASAKKPGPKSKTKGSDDESEKSNSYKNGKRSTSDDEEEAPLKKRPGPASKTLSPSKPGPASKTGRKPGPKSRTVGSDDEYSD